MLQELADRPLVIPDAEALSDDALEINPAPPHDAMHEAIRAGLDDLRELRLLRFGQPSRLVPAPVILEPFETALVEAVDPVPQCLTIHAADLRGFRPAHAVQRRRNRQQAPALVRILRRRRTMAQLRGRVTVPDRHNLRHGVTSMPS
jgi:hypothetical protein